MNHRIKGTLIIIGGHEDKEGDRDILTEVARRAKGGRLVVVTVATQLPEEVADEYRAVFADLHGRDIAVLDIRTRADAHADDALRTLDGAQVVFFTGGDQLRITSLIGGTPVFRCLHDLYQGGATIVGTSAGAAAMPETMLIAGASDKSPSVENLHMAPGLGLLPGMVIDSHFAERGRIGRLLGVVSQNPSNVGVGIDEDTAIVVEGGDHFHVIGAGAVYVADGQGVSYTSLSERHQGMLGVHDVRLHLLTAGAGFDLQTCRPLVEASAERSAA